jgi:nicotinamidase-related amidase
MGAIKSCGPNTAYKARTERIFRRRSTSHASGISFAREPIGTWTATAGSLTNDHRRATGLDRFLQDHGVTHVDVMGLATDYCVKFTALDAVQLGFSTGVIAEGVRGVELAPGDCDRAFKQMKKRGVKVE